MKKKEKTIKKNSDSIKGPEIDKEKIKKSIIESELKKENTQEYSESIPIDIETKKETISFNHFKIEKNVLNDVGPGVKKDLKSLAAVDAEHNIKHKDDLVSWATKITAGQLISLNLIIIGILCFVGFILYHQPDENMWAIFLDKSFFFQIGRAHV